MSKPSLDIIRSPTAEDMIRMVTQGFYDNSYIGLWLFEAIGREYDDMGRWVVELKREIFIQTCTWSIGLWEGLYGISTNPELPLEQRRAKLLAKQLHRPPINPAQIAGIIAAFAGCPVRIVDPISPYAFKVIVDESNALYPVDYKAAREMLAEIKPSHLRGIWETVINVEYNGYDYSAGATAEIISEFFIGDETPIETAVNDLYAGVTNEVIQDYHIGDNAPITTEIEEYDAGAASEAFMEFYVESFPMTEAATDTDAGAVAEALIEFHTENNTETAAANSGGKAHKLIMEVFTE